ncbi:GPALPP motifs-containing protein 1 [Procambarus clarkii]|uniref:GPALPP motifs-containing protein 1 n=1 Tax=Procambarus clarkii TaxID=6728 RepID=UPI001E674E46|nr:GPALPP motifs-containing protein 1-like [Procambarus clarkii]
MSASDSDSETYGPPLRPSMKTGSVEKNRAEVKSQSNDESMDEDSFLPALPPHLLGKIGVGSNNQSASLNEKRLSPNLQKQNLQRISDHSPNKAVKHDLTQKQDSESDDDDDDEDDMYGPALPPHLLNKNQEKRSAQDNRRIVGPTLPKGFVPPKVPYRENDKEENSDSEDNNDGSVIGPVPPTEEFNEEEYRVRQFELRAQRMKDRLEGKNIDNKTLVRESWMTELPEDKPNFCGLSARQFLRKTPQAKGDRSGWTDTPADKARKSEMGVEGQQELTPELIASSKRDIELSEKVNEYNKSKRAKPLIDLHQKKMKETQDASGPKERRPFSRDDDLHVNKFDDAQKSNILKKARKLNDRFSSGDRKFL